MTLLALVALQSAQGFLTLSPARWAPSRSSAIHLNLKPSDVAKAVRAAIPTANLGTVGGLDGDMGTDYYKDKLCEEDECAIPEPDEFTVAILGDLHLDPRKMEDYYKGREHFLPIFEDAKSRGVATALVSLGDLGESKSVRPEETQELFAGTTECHELAAEFLSSFGVPYEVIGGNHDLEGIDEFTTDEANLAAFCRIHKKPQMQFLRQIADKTLLVGLGSTVFRKARYTSHEVIIDDEQMAWFEDVVSSHPSTDGWKIFVFTHAPPIGSGLRVLQENHVVNGCCWINHSGGAKSDPAATTKFIELVRKHRCVKAWFSGHFHLGQDYEDSITFPTIPRELGPYPNRGSCVFAQTSVMRAGSSRDGRQQSRLIRGNKDGFEICTVDHQKGGTVRLDATISYTDTNHEVGVYAHEHAELKDSNAFIKVYSPSQGDECYVGYEEDDVSIDPTKGCTVDDKTVAWWHMTTGQVLGLYDGRLIEYEPSTLAPLGLVVGQDELAGKRVVVVPSEAPENCHLPAAESADGGVEGDCAEEEAEEQAILLVDDATGTITVVQPNEDGSYWRKIVRNKMVRMKEKRRFQAAEDFAIRTLKLDKEKMEGRVVSSWGPYTSISGTAKKTGVAGLTAPARVVAPAPEPPPAPKLEVLGATGSELASVFSSMADKFKGTIATDQLPMALQHVSPGSTAEELAALLALAEGAKEVTLQQFVMLVLFRRPVRADAPAKAPAQAKAAVAAVAAVAPAQAPVPSQASTTAVKEAVKEAVVAATTNQRGVSLTELSKAAKAQQANANWWDKAGGAWGSKY